MATEKLIDTIKQKNITPMPRWQFRLKNGLIWAGFMAAVILGALAFSVILFSIQQTDFNVISHISHSRLELLLGLLPFVWIICLAVSLIIAIYSIQHSKKGYKLTPLRMVGYSAALSILFGTLYFTGGGGQQLEQAFAVKVSLYESVQEKKVKLWSMPEEGYLSGTIEQVNEEDFRLNDFNEKVWTIQYGDAFVPPSVLVERGEKIKITGQMLSDTVFKAGQLRPWGGPRNRGKGRGRGF
jgi:heme/copper-type cytochrome/quinol oxidase subunit 2